MRQMDDRGYAMAALLVGISVMGVVLSVVLPSWSTLARREREAELVFRGQQYARAVTLFQRKFAGAYPPNLDILLTQKFLRKQYKDPITNDDFQLIPVGDARAAGWRGGDAGRPGGIGASGGTRRTANRGAAASARWRPRRCGRWRGHPGCGEQERRHVAARLQRPHEIQRVGVHCRGGQYCRWRRGRSAGARCARWYSRPRRTRTWRSWARRPTTTPWRRPRCAAARSRRAPRISWRWLAATGDAARLPVSRRRRPRPVLNLVQGRRASHRHGTPRH